MARHHITPTPTPIPTPSPPHTHPQSVVTRWGQDPLTWGSYSSVSVGGLGPEDYDAMAQPLGSRVFFAGEATSRKYPATMHGAFQTGLREAANVKKALQRLQDGQEGGGGGEGGAGSKGGEAGGGQAAAGDAKGGEGAGVGVEGGKGRSVLHPAAVRAARQLEEAARKLAEVGGGGRGGGLAGGGSVWATIGLGQGAAGGSERGAGCLTDALHNFVFVAICIPV